MMIDLFHARSNLIAHAWLVTMLGVLATVSPAKVSADDAPTKDEALTALEELKDHGAQYVFVTRDDKLPGDPVTFIHIVGPKLPADRLSKAVETFRAFDDLEMLKFAHLDVDSEVTKAVSKLDQLEELIFQDTSLTQRGKFREFAQYVRHLRRMESVEAIRFRDTQNAQLPREPIEALLENNENLRIVEAMGRIFQ